MMDQLTSEEQFLLLGKVSGSLSPDEENALEQLFQSNPHARQAYEELVSSLPVEDVTVHFAQRKENPTWRDLKTEFQERGQSSLVVKQVPFYRKKWIAAAMVIGVMAMGAVLWQQFRKSVKTDLIKIPSTSAIELKLANGQVINLSQEQGTINVGTAQLNNTNKSLNYATGNSPTVAGINTLTVPIGMDYKINLSDGSEVWLNSATQLEFPLSFSGNTREITINGEAYIKVAKNALKPFLVHLPHSTVQVLGTEFNVNTYDSGVVRVALVEGSVNMHAATGESKLTPGKQAIYQIGKSITQVVFEERNVLSWRKGLFYFNDISLEEISKVLLRWYGVKVVIENPALLSRQFSGVINRNRPIQYFIEDLKVISHIDAELDRNGVLHFK
ncbi:MAG: FecR domain-containing protein [Chitinophaga sp.]|uniref:FecR family protein n=1 Tax=Chitinophaga sp. TaxID=1869181 RepID=UPI0025C3C591|nr:FecR domain-containing protein [Chitinophaga sp.]MBV8251515.1 FecR domain-containing protein [Chitinophaga sp.]